VDIERSVKDDMMRRPAPAIRSTRGEDVTRATVLRAVPFVSQLALAANRARPIQARTRNARTRERRMSPDQLKDRKSVLVAHDPDFLFILFHLFRLLMQLRRPHTHQQRELGPRIKSAF
jgi:hypothetical protein